MEAVHELETQRDDERQREEGEGTERELLADLLGVGQNTDTGVGEAASEEGGEDPASRWMQVAVQTMGCVRLARGQGGGVSAIMAALSPPAATVS